MTAVSEKQKPARKALAGFRLDRFGKAGLGPQAAEVGAADVDKAAGVCEPFVRFGTPAAACRDCCLPSPLRQHPPNFRPFSPRYLESHIGRAKPGRRI